MDPRIAQRMEEIRRRLSIPVFAAPMFLVSGPELVIEACKAGVVGSFPTLNARPVPVLEQWMQRIERELAEAEAQRPGRIAPWAANLIVHRTNARFREDLELVVKHRVPLVISALGSPATITSQVHEYGGLVFADVNSIEYARKAAKAGADGLVLVAAGSGGHTGFITPFAFIPAVREFFDGPIIVGGGVSTGAGVRAMEILGADFVYVGTRFIATRESLASDDYKQMLVESTPSDVICTPYFTGIPANYLRPSIAAAGIDPAELIKPNPVITFDNPDRRSKAWRDIWSAGQGVASIHSVLSAAELVAELKSGYEAAKNRG